MCRGAILSTFTFLLFLLKMLNDSVSQNELEYGGDEPLMPPAVPSTVHLSNSSFPVFSGSSGLNVLQGARNEHGNMLQNQNFQASFNQNSGPPWGNGSQNNEKQGRGSNPHSSSDSFMDMH